MRIRPIHTIALALTLLLIAAGSIYYIHNGGLETNPNNPNKSADHIPNSGKTRIPDGRTTDPKFKGQTRNHTTLITNLDEAEALLMQANIDPSNRNHQTRSRMQELVSKIDPSLHPLLLARIDAALTENGYFKAKNIPIPASSNTPVEPYSESDQLKDYFREFLIREWATHNLDDALAYALATDPLHSQEDFIVAALSTLVADKPLDAMAKVTGLVDTKLRDRVRQEVYRAWLMENPASAFSWASEWPEEKRRNSYLSMGGSIIAKTDPGLALQAAAGIETAKERNHVLSGIASAWSINDPQSFAFHLQNNDHYSSSENESMVGFLVYNWYHRDKQSALDWIAGLPEGLTREEAIRFLTKTMKVEWPPKSP